jgi:hypothetical protein
MKPWLAQVWLPGCASFELHDRWKLLPSPSIRGSDAKVRDGKY